MLYIINIYIYVGIHVYIINNIKKIDSMNRMLCARLLIYHILPINLHNKL